MISLQANLAVGCKHITRLMSESNDPVIRCTYDFLKLHDAFNVPYEFCRNDIITCKDIFFSDR